MVDWKSTAEITKDAVVFQKLVYYLLGLYSWEIFRTFGFEWSLITRRRKFAWPLLLACGKLTVFTQIFYFICRYGIFLCMIGLVISFEVKTKINCQALYTFNSWAGNMSILSASTSLMLRTFAVWDRNLAVVIPLLALAITHWAILYHDIFILHASWDSAQNACIVTSISQTFLNLNYFTTIFFDLVILLVTVAGLMRSSSRSGLWHLLFRDGLVYWSIACCANTVPGVFSILDLNVSMNVITTVPAVVFSAIAACRAVVRLRDFGARDYYVNSSPATDDKNARLTARTGSNNPPRFVFARPEVQITTDHISMQAFTKTSTTNASSTPVDRESNIMGRTSSDDSKEGALKYNLTELREDDKHESVFNAA